MLAAVMGRIASVKCVSLVVMLVLGVAGCVRMIGARSGGDGGGPWTETALAWDGPGAHDAARRADSVPSRVFTTVTTLAGTGTAGHADGPLASAQFSRPHALFVLGEVIYVADRDNHVIRMISGGLVTTLAGIPGQAGHVDGPAASAHFRQPVGLFLAGSTLLITEAGSHRVRGLDLEAMQVSTLAGSGTRGFRDGLGDTAQFDNPHGIVVVGGTVYLADLNNHRIRTVDVSTGDVSTLTGDGTAGADDGRLGQARFNEPHGIAVSPGGELMVSDLANNSLRALDLDGGAVRTLAGGGGVGGRDGDCSAATFNGPSAVALLPAQRLVVADHWIGRIRLIDRNAGCTVSTLAGGATGHVDGSLGMAEFRGPEDVAVDSSGRILVADTDAHSIRRIE